MQRIERYGVIALLLLLVTVLAVSMWGDESLDPKDPATHTLASVTPEKRVPTRSERAPARTTRSNPAARRNSAVKSGLPLTAEGKPSANSKSRTPAVVKPKARGSRAQRNRRNSIKPATVVASQGAAAEKHNVQPMVRNGGAARSNPVRPASNLVVKQDRKAQARLNPLATSKLVSKKPSTWTVKSGETLSEIAQQALGSSKLWPSIVEANPGVDPARLSVGTKLRLPLGDLSVAKASSAPSKSAVSKPRAAVAASGTYTVQSGDVLSVIAQRELGSAQRWREIASLNPSVDPNRLSVGTKLSLPAPGAKHVTSERSSTALAVVRAKKPTVKRNRVR